MSDIRVYSRRTPTQTSENGVQGAWADRLGTLFSKNDLQGMVEAGYGFHVTVGAFSSPITGGGAGTVIDLDQPEFMLGIPSGTAIKIARISVQCHVPLLATDADESEILVAVDRAAAFANDGTTTAETPFNMRTDITSANGGSACTAASAATADITDPTLGIELARAVVTGDVQGTAANGLWTPLDLVYEPKVSPVIVGPAGLYIYWGGTVATPGFAQVEWIEFPEAFNAVWGGS
jgi:hypothetical protein